MSELHTAVRPTLHDLFTHLRELERLPRGEDPARFMEAPLAKVEEGLAVVLTKDGDEGLTRDVVKLRELIASRAEVEQAEDRGLAWAGFRERLEKAYDALRPTVKGLPELRPTNSPVLRPSNSPVPRPSNSPELRPARRSPFQASPTRSRTSLLNAERRRAAQIG